MSAWKLGGADCRCTSVNLGLAQTDTAEIEFTDGSGDGITDGTWYALTCDSTVILWGQATVHPSVSGRGDSVQVTLRGPWFLLECTTYQQGTKVAVAHAVDPTHPYGYALTTILTPQVLLGMDDDGAARTTRQEAVAIMAYATGALTGVGLTFSPGFTGMAMQPVQLDGSSCAACLLTVLRFHPDVLLYFEYTGSGATLHAAPVAAASAYSVGTSHRVIDASFAPVPAYSPAGIRILYQRVSADGRLEAHTDTAGSPGTGGQAPNVINWRVQLEGADPPPLQTQRIRTRSIPRSDDPDHPEDDETELKMNWWQARLSWLNLPGVAEIVTISDHTVTVDEPKIDASEDDDDDIPDTWSTDPDDYPRELIDGTIPPWLDKRAAPLTISATFTLGDTSGLSDATKEKLDKAFSGSADTERTAQVTGTDANTREYAALSYAEGPPDWPASGIAAAYMAAFSSAAWQGGCTLTGPSQPIVAMGRKLNVAGYEAGWGSMNALIRSISYSPESHQITLSCGAPDTFGFADFYELQRTMKKAAGTDARAAAARRTRAEATSGGNIRGAGFTANRSVSGPAGGGSGELIPWKCERIGLLTIRVWPAAVWDGTGNEIQPEISGEETEPEHFYDATVETDAGDGHMYLECTVDDTNDTHGKITAAALKLDFDTHTFFEKSASKVLIPVCSIHSEDESFTFTPLRTYVFCLRRFGPPGSPTWDVTPL